MSFFRCPWRELSRNSRSNFTQYVEGGGGHDLPPPPPQYIQWGLKVTFSPISFRAALQLKENAAVLQDNVPDIYAFGHKSGLRVLQSEYRKRLCPRFSCDAQRRHPGGTFSNRSVILQTLRELLILGWAPRRHLLWSEQSIAILAISIWSGNKVVKSEAVMIGFSPLRGSQPVED